MADTRIIGARVVAHEWDALKSVAYERNRPDGRCERQVREVYCRRDSATVLMRDLSRDTVLLVKQFRVAACLADGRQYVLETPAGLLDGRDPAVAIRREIAEEAGYVVGDLTKLFEIFPNPAAITEKVHCFLATYQLSDERSLGGGVHEEGEYVERVEMLLDQALEMIATGEIVDAKTILLLLYAQSVRSPRS